MLEEVQRAEVAVLQDDGLSLRRAGERHHDVALVVGRVFPSAEPERGLGQFPILFIQHREHVPGRGGAHQMPQLALADHGSAALAVADEVDDIHARLGQLRKLKTPAHAPQRRLGILVCLLLVGHQPIEVHVRVHVRLVLTVEVGRVDLVDLDDQRLHVLDEQLQADGIFGGEPRLVGLGKVQVDAILQGLVLGGRQHRRPLLALAQAVDDLGLGERAFQIQVVHPRRVRFGGRLRDEELLQVAPHQRLVVSHGRQQRNVLEVGGQIGGMPTVVVQFHELRVHVGRAARCLQVGQERRLVVNALGAIQDQSVIQHVGLERVVDGGQPLDEAPQPAKIRPTLGRVTLPIDVRVGVQLGQVDVDEVLLVEQILFQLQALVQLRQQQLPVNPKATESSAVLIAQVVDHQLRQLWIVGPLQPFQQVPSAIRRQFGRDQPVQGLVFARLQVRMLGEGPAEQCRARDQVLVQTGRQVGLLVQPLTLVIELQSQPLADELQGCIRALAVGQQGLPVLNLADARRVLVPVDPGGEQRIDLVVLLGVLEVEAMVVIVVFGARNQLLQRHGAVLGQGEIFQIADFRRLRLPGRQAQEHADRELGCKTHLGASFRNRGTISAM